MKKRILYLIICALLAVSFAGCGSEEQEVPELVEPVKGKQDTGVVQRGDLVTTDAIYGQVQPRIVQVYMEGSGTVENFNAWTGKQVKEGEVLIEFDLENIQKNIENLEKELENLRAEGAYADRLSDITIQMKNRELTHMSGTGADSRSLSLKRMEISDAERERRQALELQALKEEQINAELETLRSDLESLVVTAPVSGRVYIDENLSNGSYLMEGNEVLKIVDDSDLVFRTESVVSEFALKSEYYGWINGKRYELEYLPMDREDMMSLLAAGESLYSEFRVITDDDTEITAGMSGAVITETKKMEDVVYVPMNAISSDSGGKYLYLDADGANEKRYVTTGRNNGVMIEIISGLKEGEVFYVQK